MARVCTRESTFSAGTPASSSGASRAARRLELEDEEGGKRVLFLAPHGGGTEITLDGLEILVVTPGSALGAATLGRQQGDDVSVTLRGKRRSYVISEVR